MLKPDDLTYLVKELNRLCHAGGIRFGYGAVGVVGHWGRYTEKTGTINFTDKIRFSQKFCIGGVAKWKMVV